MRRELSQTLLKVVSLSVSKRSCCSWIRFVTSALKLNTLEARKGPGRGGRAEVRLGTGMIHNPKVREILKKTTRLSNQRVCVRRDCGGGERENTHHAMCIPHCCRLNEITLWLGHEAERWGAAADR